MLETHRCYLMKKFNVHIKNTDLYFPVEPKKTVLDAAYDSGINLQYACASGCCGACMVRLASGKVFMDHSGGISRQEAADGYILACCSYPEDNLVIDVE